MNVLLNLKFSQFLSTPCSNDSKWKHNHNQDQNTLFIHQGKSFKYYINAFDRYLERLGKLILVSDQYTFGALGTIINLTWTILLCLF